MYIEVQSFLEEEEVRHCFELSAVHLSQQGDTNSLFFAKK